MQDAKLIALVVLSNVLLLTNLIVTIYSAVKVTGAAYPRIFGDKLCMTLDGNIFCQISSYDICANSSLDCVVYWLTSLLSDVIYIVSIPAILFLIYSLRDLFMKLYFSFTYIENPIASYRKDVLRETCLDIADDLNTIQTTRTG